MTLDELKVGFFYSNGAYGRTWGVRRSRLKSASTPKPAIKWFTSGELAGTCRRKKGHCSPTEFARWAKYQVALLENDWKRVGAAVPRGEPDTETPVPGGPAREGHHRPPTPSGRRQAYKGGVCSSFPGAAGSSSTSLAPCVPR